MHPEFRGLYVKDIINDLIMKKEQENIQNDDDSEVQDLTRMNFYSSILKAFKPKNNASLIPPKRSSRAIESKKNPRASQFSKLLNSKRKKPKKKLKTIILSNMSKFTRKGRSSTFKANKPSLDEFGSMEGESEIDMQEYIKEDTGAKPNHTRSDFLWKQLLLELRAASRARMAENGTNG